MNVKETDRDYGILSRSDRWDKIRAIAHAFTSATMVLICIALILVASVANRIEKSSECRFDKNADISNVNDRIDLETGLGLKALAENNDVELTRHLHNIDVLSEQFDKLISTRSDIVEVCER